jgi:hypothetical protein
VGHENTSVIRSFGVYYIFFFYKTVHFSTYRTNV